MRQNYLGFAAAVVCLGYMSCPVSAQARVRIEAGTKLPIRLEREVGTKDSHKWRSFGPVRTVPGVLVQDISTSDGQLVLPAGTKISVAVLEDKRAGHLIGRSKLRLGLYSVTTANGDVIPVDGYPNAVNRRKADREGTVHGKRGLIKDAAFDVTSVTVGAGAGFAAAGPFGAAVGAGGGLVVAALWTVVRRGPDFSIPAGTVVEFTLGRPVSFVSTGEVVDEGASLQPSRWGQGQVIPPSPDLLELSDRVSSDPDGVLHELKEIRFKERPPVDRVFVKYLEALARFQNGDHSEGTLKLMREAYREGQGSALPPGARAEMARNLVVVMRGTESNWERDPMLNDPQIQAALVEEMR